MARSVSIGIHDQGVADLPLVSLGMGITAQIVVITPQLAKEWLESNMQVQRTVSSAATGMIARLIKENRWRLNGATIVFNDLGQLSDGQHRLASCVKSGKSIIAIVVWGIREDAFPTMDTGRVRTGADAVRASGISNSAWISGAANLLLRYKRGEPLHSNQNGFRAAPIEIEEALRNWPGLTEGVAPARRLGKLGGSPASAAFCFYVFHCIDPDDAAFFFEKLATGENLHKGCPILALRTRFINQSVTRYDYVPLVFKAWNAFRKREHVELLRLNANESTPTPV